MREGGWGRCMRCPVGVGGPRTKPQLIYGSWDEAGLIWGVQEDGEVEVASVTMCDWSRGLSAGSHHCCCHSSRRVWEGHVPPDLCQAG